MTDPRCEHKPANVREHMTDAQRDATAVYRAVLRTDPEGVAAILNHTGCQACLVVCSAMLGLALGARTPDDLTPHGWHPAYASAVEDALDAADGDAGIVWRGWPL